MINAADEILINLETSCTKDVAVAKLLGWMQGPIRSRITKITEFGIASDQLQFMPNFEGELHSFLDQMRESARQAFARSKECDDAPEVIDKHIETVKFWDKTISKASLYLQDIDDEIAKEDGSSLRIDKSATEASGEAHITVKSLDLWAKQVYGISIIDPHFSDLNFPGKPEISKTNIDHEQKTGLTKIRADNLYVTLAFAVDAIVKNKAGFRKPNGEPIVKEVARHLSVIAKASNRGEDLFGQSEESIKTRIEDAMKIKKDKLKGK